VRVTDTNSIDDLRAVLGGGGMFGGQRVVVLDGVLANEEMRAFVLDALQRMKDADEPILMLEGKLDADTRKRIEKFAGRAERYDAKSEREDGNIFALAYALKAGDKKKIWVEYQRALAREEAPEAIHGVLFWGAKDMFLKSSGASRERAEKFVAELAELPHESRRQGFELEYALEHYLLGINKS